MSAADDSADDSAYGRNDALPRSDNGEFDLDILDQAVRAVPALDGASGELQLLSRSPHPYHHNRSELLHPADLVVSHGDNPRPLRLSLVATTASLVFSTMPSTAPASDSGTEADDEHFLKGLPAPRARPHKGLRGMNEILSSGLSTPLLSPAHSRSDMAGLGSTGTIGRLTGVEGAASLDPERSERSERFERSDRSGRLSRSVAATSPISRRQHLSPQRLVQTLQRDAALLEIRDRDYRPRRGSASLSRRRREVVRRCTELLLLISLAALLLSSPDARPLVVLWHRELQATAVVVLGVLALYPVRVVLWTYRQRRRHRAGQQEDDQQMPSPLTVPASFDPAPFLYPLAIPCFVSFLLATPTLPAAPLLNMVLGLCTLPRPLIPLAVPGELLAMVHWVLSCVPMATAERFPALQKPRVILGVPFSSFLSGSLSASPSAELTSELVVLLYPLHQTICSILHRLTTTSLLPAELQLLSVALVNLFLLAASPQAVVLQGLLWGGGLGLLVTCSSVVRWGIALARVPRWRFRRVSHDETDDWPFTGARLGWVLGQAWTFLRAPRRARLEMMFGSGDRDTTWPGMFLPPSNPDDERRPSKRYVKDTTALQEATALDDHVTFPLISNADGVHEMPHLRAVDDAVFGQWQVRPDNAWLDGKVSTTSVTAKPRTDTHTHTHTHTHTPSGRRKRAASLSVRALFALTYEQAMRRKKLYAVYMYACVVVLLLGPLRWFLGTFALGGHEPIGWALGYLLGDVSAFRLEVVKAHLEYWVCLPISRLSVPSCQAGWVEHVRRTWLGVASTRLVVSAYWLAILVVGLAVVMTLSPVYEVDTRRKVFHFMMVAMLLPATFVDPAYAALALALVLGIFLLLDLLRASQLPPLSRPLALFLAPYVDGRDLRGPVVISHIFLLIGCAIPLWLSLAALPRTSGNNGALAGWELPTRDVSMVAGVVCVGLGDAAASLVGRRWGRRKWLWGGGKSLEGSIAFAVAVFTGLMAATVWLRVGGWPVTGLAAGGQPRPLLPVLSHVPAGSSLARAWAALQMQSTRTVPRAAACATVASLTEAVLTGGNDNVVVPILLWTCVKSFGL